MAANSSRSTTASRYQPRIKASTDTTPLKNIWRTFVWSRIRAISACLFRYYNLRMRNLWRWSARWWYFTWVSRRTNSMKRNNAGRPWFRCWLNSSVWNEWADTPWANNSAKTNSHLYSNKRNSPSKIDKKLTVCCSFMTLRLNWRCLSTGTPAVDTRCKKKISHRSISLPRCFTRRSYTLRRTSICSSSTSTRFMSG